MKAHQRQPLYTAVLSLSFATLVGLDMSVGLADDQTADPSVSEKQTKQKPTKPGFYTDDFHILPEFQITAYHDDNIYATKSGKESDFVTILSPTLKIDSRWNRHSLKFNTGANLGYYMDNKDEDYQDMWLEASGRYELSAKTHLFGGAGYNKKHEGRDSKDSNQSALEPTTYDVLSAQLGWRHQLQDYVIRLGVTYEKLDFDNVPYQATDSESLDDIIPNDERDRTHTGLGLRVTRPFDKQTKLYVQGFLNNRDYENLQNGVNRDSSGYSAALGLIRTFGKKDRIEAYLGVLSQEYDDPGFDTVTTPNYGVNLRWYPAESYKLTGSLSQTLGETTLEGASGYLDTKLNLQLDKKMFTDYVGYVSYGYGEADYQDDPRKDVYYSFGLGLNYYMSPHLFFSAGYSYVNNDSNMVDVSRYPLYDYEKNLFLISFKAKLAP